MIVTARLDDFVLPLATPLATARGTIFERRGLVLVVQDGDGHWGRGEVAPLPGWSSIDLDGARVELSGWVEASNGDRTVASAGGLAAETRAGIDCALWSLRAARAGVPLWRALPFEAGASESGEREVAVNALAVGSTPGELLASVADWIAAGYRCIKVKLGMPDDVVRLRALADHVPEGVSVRLDANAAWPLDEAVHHAGLAHSLLGDRLEYVEDPVADLGDLEGWAQRCEVPVAVDELVRTSADLDHVIDRQLATVLVVKPPMLGGITNVLELASVARSGAVDVVVSSLYDGPVGLSAWCHLAAALGGTRAHGLGTATLFAPGTADQLVPRAGVIRLR